MRELSQDEIEVETRKMSDTMNWPQLHLPVKNLYDEAFERRMGIILHTASYPYDVFECNQFLMGDKVIKPLREGKEPDCPVHHFNSFREVVEAGWIGD